MVPWKFQVWNWKLNKYRKYVLHQSLLLRWTFRLSVPPLRHYFPFKEDRCHKTKKRSFTFLSYAPKQSNDPRSVMASKDDLEELLEPQSVYPDFEILRLQNRRLKYRFWVLFIFVVAGIVGGVLIASGAIPPLIEHCNRGGNSDDTYMRFFFPCFGLNSTQCETDCRCGRCVFAQGPVDTSVCLTGDYKQYCNYQPKGTFISSGPCPSSA